MIKKQTILSLLLTLLLVVLTSCGEPVTNNGAEAPAGEAETEETAEEGQELLEEMQKTAVVNPWGDTQSLSVAVEGSGVEFTPPAEDSLPEGIELQVYRYMEGVFEARYGDDNNELTIRKSNDREGIDLSGDYNKYSKEWDESSGDLTIHCLGDGETVNNVSYDLDGAHFSILYNPGEEGRGLTVDELWTLLGKPGAETAAENADETAEESLDGKAEETTKTYSFRTPELRLSHFTKHGIDMGFVTEEAYEEAASRVITNSRALHKTEAEDGDDVFYVEDTNEFVVLSTDGYIRTYFNPDRGKAYFDKQ